MIALAFKLPETFQKLVPSECPDWFNEEDYAQLRLIRDQWI